MALNVLVHCHNQKKHGTERVKTLSCYISFYLLIIQRDIAVFVACVQCCCQEFVISWWVQARVWNAMWPTLYALTSRVIAATVTLQRPPFSSTRSDLLTVCLNFTVNSVGVRRERTGMLFSFPICFYTTGPHATNVSIKNKQAIS